MGPMKPIFVSMEMYGAPAGHTSGVNFLKPRREIRLFALGYSSKFSNYSRSRPLLGQSLLKKDSR
jgi:hypothetical protein